MELSFSKKVLYCKRPGIKLATSVPDDLFGPVEALADVALGRTDEKGVTENQQQQHQGCSHSLARSHLLHQGAGRCSDLLANSKAFLPPSAIKPFHVG